MFCVKNIKAFPWPQIAFTRAATTVARYIGESSQAAVLEILMEKVIRLDACLSRFGLTLSFSAYRFSISGCYPDISQQPASHSEYL